ncbi:MAG TPA: methyltransferase [Acidobacteriaceae bacterium]|jgi:protein-S-isoprenylcysteine O-methyltransferase Ste14|nr:methyltransferase [Acidobacteriaceae bacterium]
MERLGWVALRLAGFAGVYFCWRVAADHAFAFWPAIALTWGSVLLVPLFALAALGLLNRRPTAQTAALLTVPVHYMEMILLGCALIVAWTLMQAHPLARIPFPRAVSMLLMQIFGAIAALTVLNLAVRGLGLPFAAIQSSRLASGWLYAHCRNPMGLASLLFLLSAALWMQSLHAVLWVVGWFSPAWILYVRIYEERELELRFGAPYLEYKARAPFFL